VLGLSPGATRTEFYATSGADEAGAAFESAADVVATALRALDSRAAPAGVVSGRKNKVQAALAGALPRRLVLRIAGGVVRPAVSDAGRREA